MYKILNKLFGWDYLHWRNLADEGVARVYVDGDGQPYYYRYKITQVVDNPYEMEKIGNRIIWLTCSSDKYRK